MSLPASHLISLAAPLPGETRAEYARALQADWANLLGLNPYGKFLRSSEAVMVDGCGEYTFCLPDVLIDRDGTARFTEVNVSNGVFTFAHDADQPRVEHMVDTLLARGIPLTDGAVVLVPRSPDSNLAPEIMIRALQFADRLQDRTEIATSIREGIDPRLPESGVVVISGAIPTLIENLRSKGDGLRFRDRPVVFLNNPNVLAALARHEATDLTELIDRLDGRILHEGAAMTKVGFDKGLQQRLAQGTGIVPVAAEPASGIDDAAEIAVAMAAQHGGAVIKPNAASGGAMVTMVDPKDTTDDVHRALYLGAEKMLAKYGPGWEATCPLSVYEFVHAIPANGFAWDMRFEVLARPTETVITPLLARTCPAPITDRITTANSVANITGRGRGDNEMLTPDELLRRTGLPGSTLERAASGIRQWLENALASG